MSHLCVGKQAICLSESDLTDFGIDIDGIEH